MNIFALDYDPVKAAQSMVDSHVVKMILESAQLLSTVHRLIDGTKGTDKRWHLPHDGENFFYSATHINHPCSVWARTTVGNYYWLYNHFIALGEEYTYRYGKVHKSMFLAKPLYFAPVDLISQNMDVTPFALAMPDEYKVDDPIESYRNYYRLGKAHLHKWTKREKPEWIGQTN